MLIDEADEGMPGQEKPRRKHMSASLSSLDSPPPSPGQRKRKAGKIRIKINILSYLPMLL